MGAMLMLIAALFSGVVGLMAAKGKLSWVFVFSLLTIIFFGIGFNINQKEKALNEQKELMQTMRLCDAVGTGYYWKNSSQVVCPSGWSK